MKITQIRQILKNDFESFSNNPYRDVDLLLQVAINKSLNQILIMDNETLNEQQVTKIFNLSKLYKNGYPLAYLKKQQEFWSLSLQIEEGILIPRPETELLVSLTLEKISHINDSKILDLGTGSGAIALALKAEKPNASITAIDLSDRALNIAKNNSKKLNLNINLIKSNWFSAFNNTNNFHIIVSNPPYIGKNDPDIENNVLLYEPKEALFSNMNGYKDLFYISKNAITYLLPKGWLILEHGWKQAKVLQNYLNRLGYKNIQTFKDLYGNERVTLGQRIF